MVVISHLSAPDFLIGEAGAHRDPVHPQTLETSLSPVQVFLMPHACVHLSSVSHPAAMDGPSRDVNHTQDNLTDADERSMAEIGSCFVESVKCRCQLRSHSRALFAVHLYQDGSWYAGNLILHPRAPCRDLSRRPPLNIESTADSRSAAMQW